MKYKQIELSNGAKLRYVKNKVNKITVVDVMFDCGARCDTIAGLAHFTEHMFFTGTDTMSKEEISKKYFDFINVNAYTSGNYICFSGSIFTNEFGDYLSTVKDMITKSTFKQSAVDKEISVVQQEIARNNDNFRRKAGEFNRYNLSHQEFCKNEILGSKESVGSIKSKDVKDFVKKYFVAQNAEIFVTSPMSFSKVKKLVEEKLLKYLPVNEKFKKLPLYSDYIVDNSFYEVKEKDIDKCYVNINFVINKTCIDFEFKRKFTLIRKMMNDFSEGISKRVRLDKSLTYGASFSCGYNDKEGIVTFYTECDKINVKEIVSTVAEYLQDIAKNGFTKIQLDKAKREFDYSEASKIADVYQYMGKLYDLKYYNKTLDEKWLKKITKKTTLEESNELFKQVFENPIVSMSIYGNAKKSEIITKAEFKKLFKQN